MSDHVLTSPVARQLKRVGRRPSLVIASETAKRAGRSGALWGAVFGLYVLTSAVGYQATYETQAARDNLARAFGSNIGLDALIGPAHAINTVAGFVSWRALGVLSLVGSVWGLVTATRLMRGEEEGGRWELLLSGAATRRRGTAQALSGLAVGLGGLFAVTAIVAVATGRVRTVELSVGASLFFAAALVASAAMFLAVGAFASQLTNTRRRAAAIAATVLGVAYALRIVADSDQTVHWLVWLSPLGWVEELRPLTDPNAAPFLPIMALTAALAGGSVHLADRRDVGGATLAHRDSATARTGLLGGPTQLAVRLAGPVTAGWLLATAAFAALIGVVAQSATQAISGTRGVERVLANLGARGSLVNAYLGLSFLIVALLVALMSAGQAVATRAEEASGHLDHLLVRPVGRSRWLVGRVSVSAATLLIAGLVAGIAAWLGAASQHSGLRFASLVAAGLNVVPPAVFILGLGALGLGFWPRYTAGTVYGYVTWSFLVELIGGVVGTSHWVMDTSVLYHMAPAPAQSPHWTSCAALLGLGAAAASAGLLGFRRRDIQVD
jgi:ABC-2 type transport system permease protein